MSNYGVFEASSTDGHEEEQRQRQAKRNLGTAIEAAREGFGDFLGSSTDKQDYNDRLALVMNDLMQKVADSGVMPVPGVMRKVKAALRPEFRVADDHEKELRRDLFGSRKTASRSLSEIAAEIRADWKNVYFGAEPYLDAMSSLDSINDSYGQDSAKSIVAYFLSNATSWRGETARRVKKELKELSKRRAHKQADYWDDNPGFKQEIIDILDQHRIETAPAPRIAPHPDYGEGVWSDEGVKQRVLSLDPNLPPAQMVDAIMKVMDQYGYDSMDRELAFWYFSQVTGNDYNDYYDAWLETASGNYFSRKRKATRKQASDIPWFSNRDGSDEVIFSNGSYMLINPDGSWQVGDGTFMTTGQESSVERAKEVAIEQLFFFGSKSAKRKQAKSTWTVTDLETGAEREVDLGVESLADVIGPWFEYDSETGGDIGSVIDELESNLLSGAPTDGQESYLSIKVSSRKQAAAQWETFYTTDTRLDGSESEQYTARLGNGVTLEAFEDPYSTGGWGWSVWLTGDDGIKRYQVGGEAGSPDEAKKAAEAASQERKQAGSAQVLQKLEDALNDQRSVDVICSNSPDGSFSSEREISVDEGLQKVRGWVSAGDLVDTAQGGNFFDFEHRASGENVNFYITQEY